MDTGRPSVRPVLAIGLDGFEISYADRLMATGAMPALAALRQRSARFLLDHGPAQQVGLAWEHVVSGLSPREADRWSAVEFDPETYGAHQRGAGLAPFFEAMDIDVVVFDAPYVDLRRTSRARGLVGWGSHDAGTPCLAHPPELLAQLEETFGAYPSSEWMHQYPAYSEEACARMGEMLVRGVEKRRQVARWLWQEHAHACDLFYVVTGEIHAAIEGLWHGIDPRHPLHRHPSAPAAAAALLSVHQAVDRFIGDLLALGGDCPVIAFAMGGMGINDSDLQSMVLLPELLYRHSHGRALLRPPSGWQQSPTEVPRLEPHQPWGAARQSWFGNEPNRRASLLERASRKLFQTLGKRGVTEKPAAAATSNLTWHPAMEYQPYWSTMPAFALPSFFDGRVRINLAGREKHGRVALHDYAATCSGLEALIRQCRDPRTGLPAVAGVRRPGLADPRQLHASDADLEIQWRGSSNAFLHPDLGLIGPVPFRRTGGHTGPHGVAFLAGMGLEPGGYGVRSAFDLTPTLVDVLGGCGAIRLSGSSLLASFGSDA